MRCRPRLVDDDGRRPQARPDIEGCENPDRIILATDDRANLIGLKLGDTEVSDGLIVESPTTGRSPLEPSRDRVPASSLQPRNDGLADTLNAERRDFVKSASTVLEAVIWRALCRAERHSAALATGATTFSGLGLVKAVGDNVALVDLLKERTLGIRTTDALHFFA